MKKVAIIGSGIAGMTCAYYLSPHYDITLFEADDRIGGHTHTVDVEWQGETSAIDTGFIVFNDRTYPNFITLMNELGVAYQKTEMSFSVRNDAIGLEYNGHSFSTLFAQHKNLLSPAFLMMLRDIVRFNKSVSRDADDGRTIGDYLDQHRYGDFFRDNYLLPMISAIWSMGLEDCRDFPLKFFVRFFENHGLLNVVDRPPWYSIKSGSRAYIEPLTQRFAERIQLSSAVERVAVVNDGVVLKTATDEGRYDHVVFACHSNQSLAMLEQPTELQQQILGAITFRDNDVVLHVDSSILPRSRRAWASWNYRIIPGQNEQPTLTYNMNILQRLNKKSTYLVTLNEEIAEDKVIRRFNYSHPQYTREAVEAQNRWAEISGASGLHFCGAYWFNGFHEDGVRSALRVCRALGVEQ